MRYDGIDFSVMGRVYRDMLERGMTMPSINDKVNQLVTAALQNVRIETTAAFKDLTPAQQKKYLQEHPNSKHSPNYAQHKAREAKHNARIGEHLDKAFAAAKKASHHLKMYHDSANSMDEKAANKHLHHAFKHNDAFLKHWTNAEDYHGTGPNASESARRKNYKLTPRNRRLLKRGESTNDRLDGDFGGL